MTNEITQAHVWIIARNLREFGYNLTDDYVQAQVDAIRQGEKPANIVGMMIKTQLEQAGLL